MYQTVEAIYDNGRVYPDEEIAIKKGRVLITILTEEQTETGSHKKTFSSLEKVQFDLKNFKFNRDEYHER